MGCCLSTEKASSSSLAHSQKHRSFDSNYGPQKPTVEDRAPPPSADEETVKEVLSETPKSKLPPLPVQEPEPHTKFHKQLVGIEEIREKQSIHIDKIEQWTPQEITGNSHIVDESESEEASDIHSLSFSESVSTTALTDKREDEEEVTQRVFRSPAKLAPPPRKRDPMPKPKRDRVVGRSPNRRQDRSPGKRVVQSRENVRRGSRSEPGESSMRRSRSPATNRTGKSPCRARVEPVASGDDGKKRSQKSSIEDNDNVTDGGQSESLENPLVSLECFIFL